MTKHSDKKMLGKGIKFIAFALPLLFLSPYFLTMAFLNKGTTAFYIFLVLGIIIGAIAIWTVFKALKTLMRAIFN